MRCLWQSEPSRVVLPCDDLPTLVIDCATAVINHTSSLAEEQIAAVAWEAEVKESNYAADLIQLPPTKPISANPADWVCEESGMKENLWLNLSDGSFKGLLGHHLLSLPPAEHCHSCRVPLCWCTCSACHTPGVACVSAWAASLSVASASHSHSPNANSRPNPGPHTEIPMWQATSVRAGNNGTAVAGLTGPSTTTT